MTSISLNQGWTFQHGMYQLLQEMSGPGGNKQVVDLPHDYMIASQPHAQAPAGPASGFYDGEVGSYTKYVDIPAQWKDQRVYFHSDGIMMNASLEINGALAGLRHYGYTPVWIDISRYLTYGEANRITVTCNPSMQPNSRWYTGAGLYRGAELVVMPQIHIAPDGLYAYTKELERQADGTVTAYLHSETIVCNRTGDDHIVEVSVSLFPEGQDMAVITRCAKVQVSAGGETTAAIPMTLPSVALWDVDTPELYRLSVTVSDCGVFTTRLEAADKETTDTASKLFGIRTIQADSTRGLRINGRSVKLKGCCIHHDNGILGAASFFDSEFRKIRLLKESGYNAIRTAHNPPSTELLEACDRLGMYVLDEAFDGWRIAKQPGDYSQYFDTCWKQDMAAFLMRDRCHPSVIIWSTGNEVFERGGLGGGYTLSGELAAFVKTIDRSRPVTNGLCSYWSGLDDATAKTFLAQLMGQMGSVQNAKVDLSETFWEDRSEPMTNGLDIVGYNYLDDHYVADGALYPERVILGTESYPSQMAQVWSLVEQLPYVVGDFTWTAFDYIGEAGIGKSVFLEPDDPMLAMGAFALSSHGSPYPWRLGNDADYDINGNLLPQGAFRRILWGDPMTGLFVQDPAHFGKVELVSPWGWRDLAPSWNWDAPEGAMANVYVYSRGQEVELLLNGSSLGRKAPGEDAEYTAVFPVPVIPGVLEAVSYTNGEEVSRARLTTAGAPCAIRLIPEVMENHPGVLRANGCDLQYVRLEIVDEAGNLVPNARIPLRAEAEGPLTLIGFGSAAPSTDQNYTTGCFDTYRGKALAVLKTGTIPGEAELKVSGPEDFPIAACRFVVH